MKATKIRGIVALVVFLSVVVGLVIRTGTGTPSALGWRDIALICPVGALEALAGARAFLVHPIALLIAVLLIAFLVGKAFCAWICPVPHIRDFFIPKKKRLAQQAKELEERKEDLALAAVPDSDGSLPAIGGERDGSHFDARHVTLIGAVVSSFAFGFPVFCLVCPVGLTFAVVIGLWNLFKFNEASWGLIIFPIIIVLEVVVFRKWCTTFCPISALLSLVASKSKTLRPVVEKSACLRTKGSNCKTCVAVCPEKLDPHSASIPECTRCGDCVAKCPAHAISIPFLASAQAAPGEPKQIELKGESSHEQ